MRLIFLVLVLIVVLWGGVPTANSNAFLYSDQYMLQCVNSGDTVWQIAAKHVSDKDDIRALVVAIMQVNQLNNNAQLFPGQTLKIPLKK